LTSFTQIAPLYLAPPPTVTDDDETNVVPLRFAFETNQGFPVWIRNYATCVAKEGKNLNYFVVDNDENNGNNSNNDGTNDGTNNENGKNGTILVDFFPGRVPHAIYRVRLDKECGKAKAKIIDTSTKGDGDGEYRMPLPSFSTMEELLYPFLKKFQTLFTKDRGTACCATILDPTTNKEVFLGVSHPKTPYPGKNLPAGLMRNTYLSRFYVFEKTHPYKVLARTGAFCLGRSQEDTGNPLWNVSDQTEMEFGSEWINCPKIHFISGITEKVGDDSKVILAYGVSDCLSRFVEVDKADIAKMLWYPEQMTK
jgi:hypothetical protein